MRTYLPVILASVFMSGSAFAEAPAKKIAIDPVQMKKALRVTLHSSCVEMSDSGNDFVGIKVFISTTGPMDKWTCKNSVPIVYAGADGMLRVYSVKGAIVSEKKLDLPEIRRVIAAFSALGKDAPVVIEVNRESLEIERIIPTSDLLPSEDSRPDFG